MNLLFTAMVSGLEISLLALAFNVVYLPTGVFHLAVGGVYVVVPYVALALLGQGLPWPLSIPVVVAFAAVLSTACEWGNHRRLERRSAGSGAHFVSSLGLFIVMGQTVALIWGNDPQTLRAGVDSIQSPFGLSLTYGQLIAVSVSGVTLISFYIWLALTDVGLHLRALAADPRETELAGHDVEQLRTLAFGLSGVLCAVSALVTARDVGFDPHTGMAATLGAIVAAILGGRYSFWGPLLGGLLIGAIRVATERFVGSGWQDVAVFLLLGLCLFFLPNGILGHRQRVEAVA